MAIATVLVARGYSTAESIERYLNPRLSDIANPLLLDGMEKAVDRIWKAIAAQQQIVV